MVKVAVFRSRQRLKPPPAVPIESGSVMMIRQILIDSDFLTMLSPDQVAVELEAIRVALELAGETGCALHIVHVSSGAGVAERGHKVLLVDTDAQGEERLWSAFGPASFRRMLGETSSTTMTCLRWLSGTVSATVGRFSNPGGRFNAEDSLAPFHYV